MLVAVFLHQDLNPRFAAIAVERLDSRRDRGEKAGIGINGGSVFKHSEAFSFQIATDSQEETDRYWDGIVGHGGEASACGWCKDKWGCRGRSRRAC